MNDEKFLEKSLALVEKLYYQTKSGLLDWEENDHGAFETHFGPYALRIRTIPDPDYPDEPDYEISVVNEKGSVIERIGNVNLRPVLDRTTPEGLTPYGLLESIYHTARRKALRVDNALDSILVALEKG